MNSEWPEVRLGDLSEVITKGTTPTSLGYQFTETGINFVKSESVTFDGWIDPSKFARIDAKTHAALKRSQLKEGDVLFSMAGIYIGKTAVVPKDILPANTNQAVGIVRLDQTRAHPRFIDYFLRNPTYNLFLNNLVSQSAQPNLNLAEIRNLPIALPPLPEQRAIASILGALDDKIELNRRMNATLEAMARALFQSWFVDFDPVRAKSEGRAPSAMDAETAALFPSEFVDSELGLIPKGWSVRTIQDVSVINNWTLSKADKFETLEYVEISEVNSGNIGTVSTYLRGDEPSRARRRLRHGDTVLSTVRPDRGAYFLSLNPQENRVVSTGFAVLTPTKVPWSFLHAALTRPEVSEHLGHMADGGAYPAVRPEIIGAIQIALSDEPSVLTAFHQTCSSLFEQAECNREQSRTLAALRDTLLPRLLSGELSVADISSIADPILRV
jgi:type I restriction enzyme S subunit